MERLLNRLKQSSVILILVIIFSKVIGMARDVVLAKYYGTTNISDAYLVAMSVPTLLFYFIGHALSTAFLPMYSKIRATQGESAGITYANNLIYCAVAFCSIILGVLLVFPQYVIRVFAAGFDTDTLELTTRLIRISSSSIYIMTLIYVWSGFLQANNNFIVPAAISLPRNIIIMLSIIMASLTDNVIMLGLGILFAYVAELVFLLPFVFKCGYYIRPFTKADNSNLRETLNLVFPIVIGVGVSQVNKIVDKSIASTIVVGGISALSYAAVLNNAIQEILVTGIITILFAKCAAWVAEGRDDLVSEKLQDTIQIELFLLIPASTGIITLAEEIVACILSRGQFNAISLNLTTLCLQGYTIGLVFLAIRDTQIKILYAYKDTKLATTSSIAAIVVNIVMDIVLSKLWGIMGLAVATSVAAIFQCAILWHPLKNKVGKLELRKLILTVSKSLIASFSMVLGIGLFRLACTSRAIHPVLFLSVEITVGGVSYIFVSILLRNPMVVYLINRIKDL